MKKSVRILAALGVFLLLSPGNLFADCPTITQHSCCGGGTWKTYTFDLACAWVSGGVTTANSCVGTGHRVAYPTTATQSIQYQYTIPQSSSGWEARLDYDFNNGGSTSNFIVASYTVVRNFSTIDSGNIINVNTTTFCTHGSVSGRSWNAGDVLTVTVSIRTANSGAYADLSNLVLFKVPA